MYQRQEKIEKTTRNPKNSRRLPRCQQHPRNKFCKKESACSLLRLRMKDEISLHHVVGIANVFGDFYEHFYGDNEQDEYGNESIIDVHISDTEETTRIPEITSEKLQDAIRKLKKVNHQTARGFEQKTSKLVTRRRKKWWGRSSTKS